MANDGSNSPRARDRSFTSAFALIATATACAIVLLSAPRAVPPEQLPTLMLDRAQVSALLRRDRERAEKAPDGPRVRALYQLYLEEGRAEQRGTAGVSGTPERHLRIARLSPQVLREVGSEGAARLRARATERFMLAREGKLSDAQEAAGLTGTFPQLLARYGLTSEDGSLLAPELSVRAMYKARWNLIHERELLEGLDPLEVQAYQGWNALHTDNIPPSQRTVAARDLSRAGGHRGREALAIWLFQAGQVDDAITLMRKAYEERGELRPRNMALYMAMHRQERGLGL